MENIARVSLKITDKFTSSISSSKQRRKSSKNEFHSDEQSCLSKNLPIKENEDGEKLILKSKKTIKSSSKSTDQKKNLKRSGNEINHMNRNTKKIRISQCKNKKKNKVDKQEAKLEYIDSNINHIKSNKYLSIDYKNSDKKTLVKDTSDIEIEMSNDNIRKIDSSREIKNVTNINTNVNTKSWTRQEDMILLQAIKKEYSENSLAMVSKILGNRTIEQVSIIIYCIIYNFLIIFNI